MRTFRRVTMSSTAKKDGASYWVRVAIWLILSFAGWFLPPVGPVTVYGMKVLSIFTGLMFGWRRSGKHFLLRRLFQRDCCRHHCVDDVHCLRQQGGAGQLYCAEIYSHQMSSGASMALCYGIYDSCLCFGPDGQHLSNDLSALAGHLQDLRRSRV